MAAAGTCSPSTPRGRAGGPSAWTASSHRPLPAVALRRGRSREATPPATSHGRSPASCTGTRRGSATTPRLRRCEGAWRVAGGSFTSGGTAAASMRRATTTWTGWPSASPRRTSTSTSRRLRRSCASACWRWPDVSRAPLRKRRLGQEPLEQGEGGTRPQLLAQVQPVVEQGQARGDRQVGGVQLLARSAFRRRSSRRRGRAAAGAARGARRRGRRSALNAVAGGESR